MKDPGYRTLIKRVGLQYVVVWCDRGIFMERRKAWPHGHYRRHWILNTTRPHRAGTIISPRKALGVPRRLKNVK